MVVVATRDEEKQKSRDCSIEDIKDCRPSTDYYTPPTPECCDELKQNVDCFYDYRQVYPHLDYVYAACYINFDKLYLHDTWTEHIDLRFFFFSYVF